jgi:hypothetical protein
MKVITSEYAREMAHNLDDLRERWALRKQAQNDVVKIKEPARFNVDYLFVPQKIDHSKLFDLLSDLNTNIRKYKNEVDQVQGELGNKFVNSEGGVRLTSRQYNAWREALKEELIYKKKLVRYLEYVEKCYHMNRDHMINYSKYEDEKTELLRQCRFLFAKLAKERGICYAPDEKELLDKIWAYLAQEFNPDKAVELDEPYKLGGEYFKEHWPHLCNL